MDLKKKQTYISNFATRSTFRASLSSCSHESYCNDIALAVKIDGKYAFIRAKSYFQSDLLDKES